MIKRALLSVSDKTGIVDFASALAEKGVELISTGGTEKALSAVSTGIGTASRKLDDNGFSLSPIGIVIAVHEFPTDTEVIEVFNVFSRRRFYGFAIDPKSKSPDRISGRSFMQRCYESEANLFAFAANNIIDVWIRFQDPGPVIGRKNATDDGLNAGIPASNFADYFIDDWLRRC